MNTAVCPGPNPAANGSPASTMSIVVNDDDVSRPRVVDSPTARRYPHVNTGNATSVNRGPDLAQHTLDEITTPPMPVRSAGNALVIDHRHSNPAATNRSISHPIRHRRHRQPHTNNTDVALRGQPSNTVTSTESDTTNSPSSAALNVNVNVPARVLTTVASDVGSSNTTPAGPDHATTGDASTAPSSLTDPDNPTCTSGNIIDTSVSAFTGARFGATSTASAAYVNARPQ
ncbi:MAG: hypothetical protein R2705_07500 [Ilumatobacteraceae bacterium]